MLPSCPPAQCVWHPGLPENSYSSSGLLLLAAHTCSPLVHPHSASGILDSLLRMLQCPNPTSRYWGATLLHLLCHVSPLPRVIYDTGRFVIMSYVAECSAHGRFTKLPVCHAPARTELCGSAMVMSVRGYVSVSVRAFVHSHVWTCTLIWVSSMSFDSFCKTMQLLLGCWGWRQFQRRCFYLLLPSQHSMPCTAG